MEMDLTYSSLTWHSENEVFPPELWQVVVYLANLEQSGETGKPSLHGRSIQRLE
jgi:hypothetical protein